MGDLIKGETGRIEIGTILWEMQGKKRNKTITWYPVPKSVEEITKHMYMFGDGHGVSHNSIGSNVFLSREECINHFLKSHDSLVTECEDGDDLPDKVYELPRTDWQDYEVCRFDGVDAASVYLNGLNHLVNVTDQLSWRRERCGFRGDIEVLTLTEIYAQLTKDGHRPMITVFLNGPMNCNVFQCGNYETGKWCYLGRIQGYA